MAEQLHKPEFIEPDLDSGKPEPSMSGKFVSEIWELSKIIIVSLLIVVPIRLFVAQPFIVRGASMEPNFHEGEYLIVDEASYYMREPVRGEVIVFRYPQDTTQFFIKRIIGLPGETVRISGGKVTIINDTYPEGLVLEEDYLSVSAATTPDQEVIVDKDKFFVMGDNRPYSSDSRRWGMLDEKYLIGRALVRLWPPADIGVVVNSSD